MADSLQQAEESRRALTADIAHELRTPLAVQRANLEAMQDGVYPLNPDNLVPVLEQNLLLTRLVDDLRTLALADAGQLTLERTLTDLPDLLHRVVERFQSQASIRNISLQLEPTLLLRIIFR
jgi:signal transduction histidine kinase